MTHNSNSCKKCSWCGELEPESGLWERRGRLASTQTILCNSCNPEEDVDHGTFVVYNFTMDTKNERIQELISDWIEASGIKSEWKAIKDTGLEASTDGHSRCKLIIEIKDGASHYRLRDLLSLKSVIDVANGDPERNNTRVKIYNYDVGKEVLKMKDPCVFAASEGHPESITEEKLSYEDRLDQIIDSYNLIKAEKERKHISSCHHHPLASGADVLRKARSDNIRTRENMIRRAISHWKHASNEIDDKELSQMIDDDLVSEASDVLDKHA